MIESYRDLDVWRKSVDLTTDLYKLTSRFPASEQFGLTSRIRRAATSIPANIAEGWGRGSTSEYLRFASIARGSVMELETHLTVACNLQFLKSADLGPAMGKAEDVAKMLNRLISALKARKEGAGS